MIKVLCVLHENAGRRIPPFFGVFEMLKKIKGVVVGVVAGASAVPALAAGPDFATLTAAVDFGTAITAILLVMAGLAGVYIVMKGGSLILSKLRGG